MAIDPTPLVSVGRSAQVVAILIFLLALTAYWHLLWPGGSQAAGATDLAILLFRPGTIPAPLAVAVAGFSVWNRRARLRSLSGPGAPLGACVFAAVGIGLFVWSRLTGNPGLLLPSLAANGLAVATAACGWAGCRVAGVPAAILLLGIPLPKPLEDEVLWQLQLGAASAASWLLAASGHDIVRDGVILNSAQHSFHVIDGCSGLSGIAILVLIALIVRELFSDAGPRGWTVVAVAPLLGFVLNAFRVAFVASSASAEALGEDHTMQGIAVLMVGTAILYGLGWLLATPVRERTSPAVRPIAIAGSVRTWTLVGFAGLALSSFAIPRFREADRSAPPAPFEFPQQKSGWRGKYVEMEPMFHGVISGGAQRRYALQAGPNHPPQLVDFLVGSESPDNAASFRLLCSKLAFPGPDWDLVERRRETLGLLDREVELAFFASGEERAVSYSWRPRDRGLWRESWRAWLSLDATPLRRERPRAGVRLVAYAPHGGPLVFEQAKQRLDRFVRDFREELDAL